jgi:hypothetical protein
MAEVETKELAIDSEEVSMQEYKKARAEGVTTIEKPVEKPAEESDEKPEEKPDSGEQPKEKPKARGGVEKRIDNLVKRLAAAEKALEEAKNGKASEQTESPEPKTDESESSQEEFPLGQWITKEGRFKSLTMQQWFALPGNSEKTEAEYLDSRDEARETYKEKLAEQNEEVARQKRIEENYEKRVKEAKAKYEDWDEIYDNVKDVRIPDIAYKFIQLRKNGPDISYYLAKHPEVYEQMNELNRDVNNQEDQAEILDIVSRISHKLSEEKPGTSEEDQPEEKPVKIVSRSAPPIKPVSGGNTKSSVPLDQMSMTDYRKHRAAGRIR